MSSVISNLPALSLQGRLQSSSHQVIPNLAALSLLHVPQSFPYAPLAFKSPVSSLFSSRQVSSVFPGFSATKSLMYLQSPVAKSPSSPSSPQHPSSFLNNCLSPFLDFYWLLGFSILNTWSSSSLNIAFLASLILLRKLHKHESLNAFGTLPRTDLQVFTSFSWHFCAFACHCTEAIIQNN